jgi:hypothetical protein
VAKTIRQMATRGWKLFSAWDISIKAADKSIIVFEKCEEDMKVQEVYGCSLYGEHSMLLLGTENKSENYSDFFKIVRKSAAAYANVGHSLYSFGIWRQSKDHQKALEINVIFCRMFAELEKAGFHFLYNVNASSRVSGEGNQIALDLDTIFFIKN